MITVFIWDLEFYICSWFLWSVRIMSNKKKINKEHFIKKKLLWPENYCHKKTCRQRYKLLYYIKVIQLLFNLLLITCILFLQT